VSPRSLTTTRSQVRTLSRPPYPTRPALSRLQPAPQPVPATGQFLGWFHLRPPEGAPVDEPELGYRLRRSAWGQGYATEGSRALIHKAFSELGARRVFAETMAVNSASRRVMEKAGLRLVRTFRRPWPDPIEGDEHGEVEYALSKAEWERLAGWSL
jgi:RimJ/RimL family protein N-acetyltransferase